MRMEKKLSRGFLLFAVFFLSVSRFQERRGSLGGHPGFVEAISFTTADDIEDDTSKGSSSSASSSWFGKNTTSSLWEAFQCSNRGENPLPIQSDDDWKQMQSIYQETVGLESSSLPPGGYLGIDGFYVPVEVRWGTDGRGIYALSDIEEGMLIWRSFRTARFESGEDFVRYLYALPSSSHWACDILMWAYTRLEHISPPPSSSSSSSSSSSEGQLPVRVVICVDLDPGSFMNDCETEEECTAELWSHDTPRTSGCRLDFRASRDIAKGEELRIDYGFSEKEPGWAEMGLDSEAKSVLSAWKEKTTKKDSDTGIWEEL